MKARNKKTGEVVSNFGWSKDYGTISYIDADGVLHNYSGRAEDWEVLDESETDWAAYRREVAKDILSAIITMACVFSKDSRQWAVKTSLQYADELIKQLQTN